MSGQALFFLTMALGGFVCAFGYDWLRLLRRVFRHPAWLVNLEDALYWAAATGAVFYILLAGFDGVMRGFVLLGAFLGMALYRLAVSPAVMRVGAGFARRVKRVVFGAMRAKGGRGS